MTKANQNYRIKTPIKNITADSRKVAQGSLFLAYPGEKIDGRNFIADAIKNGASAVLWDLDDFSWPVEWTVENIGIKNLRLQAGILPRNFIKNHHQNYGLLA